YNIDEGKKLSAEGMRAALHTKENVTNKTDAINSSNNSSNTQYPSVKAVYDLAVHQAGAQTITGVKTFGAAGAAAEPKLGAAKTTDAANDGTKFATEAQVYKAVQGVDILPSGTILAMATSSWVNASATFKSKWRVCDGSGGTPNLIGRFLRGGIASDNATGGADNQNITLTKDNLPAHNHTMQNAGNHSHSVSMKISGSDKNEYFSGWGTNGSWSDQQNVTGVRWYAPFSASTDGNHVHPIDNAGDGKPFTVDTVPAYYAVIYVMKVA
ncbi:MAG: hypothetical protein LBJ25_04375, partial [Candidatus Margulisbacteria bacterium]|nr:hypothetical protein [Candidatus Margulisiibacteriota bacterium]